MIRLVPAPLRGACTPRVGPAGPALAPDALMMPDGARLPLHGVPLGLHGFSEASRNFLAEAAPKFTSRGIAVHACDQRGFGAGPHPGIWAGGDTLAADATEAARLIRAHHPGLPLPLMGESMGAAVLLVAASRPEPPPADAYTLSAPALWGRDGMPGFIRDGRWLAEER